jgi:hypothetical protein
MKAPLITTFVPEVIAKDWLEVIAAEPPEAAFIAAVLRGAV